MAEISAFLNFVKNNDYEKITDVLRKKEVKVNQQDERGRAALHVAADEGHAELVQLFLNQKAGVNITDKQNKTALHIASEKGHVEVARVIVAAYGVKLNIVDNAGTTPLHLAAKSGCSDIARLLIDSGCRVNVRDKQKRSALHFAAEGGHQSIVTLLIESQGDVMFQDRIGQTALHRACRIGHTAIVNRLIKAGCSVNLEDKYRRTALLEAVRNGHVETVERILDPTFGANLIKEFSKKAVVYAVLGGHLRVVELLVENDFDTNALDSAGVSALHHASKDRRVDMVRLLIKSGCDINIQNKFGKKTALHYVAERGLTEAIKLLVENECDVNIQDWLEKTALHYVAERDGPTEAMKFLIEGGCDVNLQDQHQKTAMHYVADCCMITDSKLCIENDFDVNIQGDLRKMALHSDVERRQIETIKLLIENGNDVSTQDHHKKTALHYVAECGKNKAIKILIDSGSDVTLQDCHKKTALHYASEFGDVDSVISLRDAGCPVDAVDSNGMTAVDFAAVRGHADIATALLKDNNKVVSMQAGGYLGLHYASVQGHADVIDVLIQAGCDVNAFSRDGFSALHYASAYGHIEAVNSLIQIKCDVNIMDYRGQTALFYAAENRHSNIFNTLLDKGCDIGIRNRFGETAMDSLSYIDQAKNRLSQILKFVRNEDAAKDLGYESSQSLESIAPHMPAADGLDKSGSSFQLRKFFGTQTVNSKDAGPCAPDRRKISSVDSRDSNLSYTNKLDYGALSCTDLSLSLSEFDITERYADNATQCYPYTPAQIAPDNFTSNSAIYSPYSSEWSYTASSSPRTDSCNTPLSVTNTLDQSNTTLSDAKHTAPGPRSETLAEAGRVILPAMQPAQHSMTRSGIHQASPPDPNSVGMSEANIAKPHSPDVLTQLGQGHDLLSAEKTAEINTASPSPDIEVAFDLFITAVNDRKRQVPNFVYQSQLIKKLVHFFVDNRKEQEFAKYRQTLTEFKDFQQNLRVHLCDPPKELSCGVCERSNCPSRDQTANQSRRLDFIGPGSPLVVIEKEIWQRINENNFRSVEEVLEFIRTQRWQSNGQVCTAGAIMTDEQNQFVIVTSAHAIERVHNKQACRELVFLTEIHSDTGGSRIEVVGHNHMGVATNKGVNIGCVIINESNEIFRNKIKGSCSYEFKEPVLRFHVNSAQNLIEANVTKLGKGSGHTYGEVIASQNVRSFCHVEPSKAIALETFGVRSRPYLSHDGQRTNMFATLEDSGSLVHETAPTPDEIYAFGFVWQEFDVIPEDSEEPERAIICTKITDNMDVFKQAFNRAYDFVRHDRAATLDGNIDCCGLEST